jgi:hypothetical protein
VRAAKRQAESHAGAVSFGYVKAVPIAESRVIPDSLSWRDAFPNGLETPYNCAIPRAEGKLETVDAWGYDPSGSRRSAMLR